jgi:hypothetical protein
MDRRQPAEDTNGRGDDTNLLAGFAQRRRLERLVGVDGTARERDLSGMFAKAGSADGEKYVRDFGA